MNNQPVCKKCGYIAAYKYLPRFFKNGHYKNPWDPKFLFHVKAFCNDCGILIHPPAFVTQTEEVIKTMQRQLEEAYETYGDGERLAADSAKE